MMSTGSLSEMPKVWGNDHIQNEDKIAGLECFTMSSVLENENYDTSETFSIYVTKCLFYFVIFHADTPYHTVLSMR